MLTPADRKYLGWTVALFALLGLVGAGTLLYRPVRLRYAVYRVQHTTWDDIWKKRVDAFQYESWLGDCIAAACQGNARAMEAVIDASGFGDGFIAETTCTMAYEVAARQPQAFFRVLARRPDAQVIEVLGDIAAVCAKERPGNYDWAGVSLKEVADELVICSQSSDLGPEFRQTAAAALDFTRRRFAKELAEAEKDKK
jgi:hypothetical protein